MTAIREHLRDLTPLGESLKGVGTGLLLSSGFAVAGGLVMGLGKLFSTGRQSKKEDGKFEPDWTATTETAIISARASWTAGGFASFLFPNALRYGVGQMRVSEYAAHHPTVKIPTKPAKLDAFIKEHKLIPETSKLVKVLDKLKVADRLGPSTFGQSMARAAVLGSVVGLAGGLAVFAQRLTDTAMSEWEQGNGFKPDLKKSGKSAVKVATIGLIAGGVASFLLRGLIRPGA